MRVLLYEAGYSPSDADRAALAALTEAGHSVRRSNGLFWKGETLSVDLVVTSVQRILEAYDLRSIPVLAPEDVAAYLSADFVIDGADEASPVVSLPSAVTSPVADPLRYEHLGGGYYAILRGDEKIGRVRGKANAEKWIEG